MTDAPNPDLPSPLIETSAPSRALTVWSAEPLAAPRAIVRGIGFRIRNYWPYAVGAAVVLSAGLGVANVATAPALTDGLDEVASIDARQMGLAASLDPDGQRRNAAALGRDLGSLKSEVTRLQRALDQARQSQAALSKTTAGQTAANLDEVRSLKSEVASLQKTLDQTRDAATTKLDALQAKVDQPKPDDAHIAELRERVDRIEASRNPPPQIPLPTARRDDAPDATGSIDKKPAAPAETVVRNWVVRDVSGGVALLEGRSGMIEVMRGARAPGLGRITAIERRDGQWVVVTQRGVILPRSGL